MEINNFILNNNFNIPCIGTGPSSLERAVKWKRLKWLDLIPLIGPFTNRVLNKLSYLKAQRKWINTLSESLRIGYRLIDYSAAYGNEHLIKKAIEKSGLNRDDVFIISRATNNDQYNHRVRESFMSSLKKIGVDYLDLYMFHWPVTGCYVETYKEIEKLYKEGFVKAIGVCNCHQHHIETIMKECEITPMVNEFEVHPLFTQKPLIQFCKNHNIHVIAYTPLAKNDDRLQKNLILRRIAQKYDKTIYQVILRWDIQNGLTPIPYSLNINHNRQNIDIFDFAAGVFQLLIGEENGGYHLGVLGAFNPAEQVYGVVCVMDFFLRELTVW